MRNVNILKNLSLELNEVGMDPLDTLHFVLFLT